MLLLLPQRYVFSSKSQPLSAPFSSASSCCCYHKGTYFQANHNPRKVHGRKQYVVVATTKVRIFKQITTIEVKSNYVSKLLLLPQRYVFSSKSQLSDMRQLIRNGCCCYHKGTYFQANHNRILSEPKDFTLLLLPQRYVFSSKSQHFFHYKYPKTVVVVTTKVRIFKQITTYFF